MYGHFWATHMTTPWDQYLLSINKKKRKKRREEKIKKKKEKIN